MMSITYLRKGCRVLADYCVSDITANEEYLRSTVENSIGLVTALAPTVGYENATAIAKYAQESGTTVKTAAIKLGLLSAEQFDEILGDVDKLSGQS